MGILPQTHERARQASRFMLTQDTRLYITPFKPNEPTRLGYSGKGEDRSVPRGPAEVSLYDASEEKAEGDDPRQRVHDP